MRCTYRAGNALSKPVSGVYGLNRCPLSPGIQVGLDPHRLKSLLSELNMYIFPKRYGAISWPELLRSHISFHDVPVGLIYDTIPVDISGHRGHAGQLGNIVWRQGEVKDAHVVDAACEIADVRRCRIERTLQSHSIGRNIGGRRANLSPFAGHTTEVDDGPLGPIG